VPLADGKDSTKEELPVSHHVVVQLGRGAQSSHLAEGQDDQDKVLNTGNVRETD
jgi:hypothetical protein